MPQVRRPVGIGQCASDRGSNTVSSGGGNVDLHLPGLLSEHFVKGERGALTRRHPMLPMLPMLLAPGSCRWRFDGVSRAYGAPRDRRAEMTAPAISTIKPTSIAMASIHRVCCWAPLPSSGRGSEGVGSAQSVAVCGVVGIGRVRSGSRALGRGRSVAVVP